MGGGRWELVLGQCVCARWLWSGWSFEACARVLPDNTAHVSCVAYRLIRSTCRVRGALQSVFT